MINNKELIEIDINLENSYAKLPEIFFTKQVPSKVPSPKIVVINHSLIESLGLNIEFLESVNGIEFLSGNKLPKKSVSIAQAYAGHQFGHFTMLGDGRAILIGEYITPKGNRVDIQLKGSGRTPYSRGGDGKAALGPMLREYIISEAMYALNIPTTRSLAVVETGEKIVREDYLKGAVLTRIALSHIRVGTFQFASRFGDFNGLRELTNYTIERHYRNLKDKDNKYYLFLEEVIKRQAELISKWQLVGFIHGVMNTDNMTISGETIDYGPCAFMDTYNPGTVFSSIDRYGRYSYENQPQMAAWNLARFSETLLPLLDEDKDKAVKLAQKLIDNFANIYKKNWLSGMRSKLGLFTEEIEDEKLIEELLNIMNKYGADYTNTFYKLTLCEKANLNKKNSIAMFNTTEFNNWYTSWHERLSKQKESLEESINLMKKSNPVIIPRNYKVEEALKAAVENNDYSVMDNLLSVLLDPYNYSKSYEEYTALPEASNKPYRTFCGT